MCRVTSEVFVKHNGGIDGGGGAGKGGHTVASMRDMVPLCHDMVMGLF